MSKKKHCKLSNPWAVLLTKLNQIIPLMRSGEQGCDCVPGRPAGLARVALLAGTLEGCLGYHPPQDRLKPSRSAAGLKCRTGGSNSRTLLGDGRDRQKRPADHRRKRLWLRRDDIVVTLAANSSGALSFFDFAALR
jgi:hypothetical protein